MQYYYLFIFLKMLYYNHQRKRGIKNVEENNPKFSAKYLALIEAYEKD